MAVVISLSLQVKVGLACEDEHKSEKVLQLVIHPEKVHSVGVLPIQDIALARVKGKRVWVKKNTPLKKSQSVNENFIHAKIKSVITDYKTGLNNNEKNQITKFILKHSKMYGYDPLFLTALIITESSFNHRAKSKVGALGLMQIRPKTGRALATEANMKWRGKHTLYHPENNIALGSYYLNKLVNRFGDMKTALEAYNYGPTRTARYLRRGKRTKKYSGKVFAIYNQIKLAKAQLWNVS